MGIASAPDPAAAERIGELLRAHGLRRMASRIAVLGVLEPVNGQVGQPASDGLLNFQISLA